MDQNTARFFFRAHNNTNEHFVMNGKPDTRSKRKHSPLCKICITPPDGYSGVNRLDGGGGAVPVFPDEACRKNIQILSKTCLYHFPLVAICYVWSLEHA